MAAIQGYANTVMTRYGTASFWVVTDVHMRIDTVASTASMTITLSGFVSQTDADAGVEPIGNYSFVMSQADFMTVFGGAQSTVQAAIVASDPAWAGATFVPAA